MLTIEELCQLTEMPAWADISLSLYKKFTIDYLLPKTFRYYFVHGGSIDVEFKEWGMRHIWALHHVDNRIKKNELFTKIDNGLDFNNIAITKKIKKRLIDNRDRIRMFACVNYILKEGNIFFIEGGKLKDSDVRVDYLKSKIISGKGVNVGLRFEEGVYVPLTILIDKAIDPQKTIRGLTRLNVARLEIIESGEVIETVHYNYAKEIRNTKRIYIVNKTKNIPICFRNDTYSEKLKRIKLKNRMR